MNAAIALGAACAIMQTTAARCGMLTKDEYGGAVRALVGRAPAARARRELQYCMRWHDVLPLHGGRGRPRGAAPAALAGRGRGPVRARKHAPRPAQVGRGAPAAAAWRIGAWRRRLFTAAAARRRRATLAAASRRSTNQQLSPTLPPKAVCVVSCTARPRSASVGSPSLVVSAAILCTPSLPEDWGTVCCGGGGGGGGARSRCELP
jgi:hypothetical protein